MVIVIVKKKTKSPICDLRSKLNNNKNHSIFVGDKAYKTDFWLRFLVLNSNTRFQKYMSQLNYYGLKFLMLFTMIFIPSLFLLSSTNLSLTNILIILITLAISYVSICYKWNFAVSRMGLTFATIYTVYYLDLSIIWKIITIILSNMTIDMFMIIEWYKHLMITTGMLLLFQWDITFVPILIVEIVIYSLYELLLKRAWVLKDTSK